MKKINVSDKYDILISRGILPDCGQLIRGVSSAARAAVIADSNTAALYSDTVCRSLRQAGFDTCCFEFPYGEKHKQLSTVTDMLTFLSDNSLTRTDIVVALGGGVCGDMAGFAAAIYLRGIDLVQIPTSLLAQVDSSVGGKTGCDTPAGKNTVGSFYLPRLVIIDPDVLFTLPEYYYTDGMGEVIKYGYICSQNLLKALDKQLDIEDIIYECVKIKADIVERDFRESGDRKLLNLGHTVGHAIEKLDNFEGISHGRAVAVGTVYAAKLAAKLGYPDITEEVISRFGRFGLPTSTHYSGKELAHAALSDKKRSADNISLVLPDGVGRSVIHTLGIDRFVRLLEEINL